LSPKAAGPRSRLARVLVVLLRHKSQPLAALLPSYCPRDDADQAALLVKPVFTAAALAAVPVHTNAYASTTADSSSSSSSSSSSRRPLIDLLILQPDGNLILYRGAARLLAVRLSLPHGHMQRLQHKLAAAAASRQHWQQQQQLQQSPGQGAAAAAVRDRRVSLECRSMSEGEDGEEDMLETPLDDHGELPPWVRGNVRYVNMSIVRGEKAISLVALGLSVPR